MPDLPSFRRSAPLLLVSLAFLGTAGCGSRTDDPPRVAPGTIVSIGKPSAQFDPANPGLKPFREAVLHEVPPGEQRPPDSTAVGKSVGKLYEQVAAEFDRVRFTDGQGRRI